MLKHIKFFFDKHEGLIVVLSLVLIVWGFGLGLRYFVDRKDIKKQEKIERQESIQRHNVNKIVSKLAIKHNAKIIDIDGIMNNHESFYSVYLAQALANTKFMPVVIKVYFVDLLTKSGKNYVCFRYYKDESAEIDFVLECNLKQMNKLLDERPSDYDEYAIVVTSLDIGSPRFNVENNEYSKIISSIDFKKLIGTGKLLDWQILEVK